MNVTFMSRFGAVLMVSTSVFPASAQTKFHQTNLVSDQAGQAMIQDPSLVNSWGISEGPTTPFWISDNGTGLATVYSVPPAGPPSVAKVPLTVTIPAASGLPGDMSAPTGQVFNNTSGFDLRNGNGKALFLFDSEDGAISGWNGGTNAVTMVNNDKNANPFLNAVYKGLAISDVPSPTSQGTLYATNFRSGFVEMYNSNFDFLGQFSDSNLPAGYAPFNDKVIGDELYVTYAEQDAAKHDDVPGQGHGFVDVFNLNGTLKERLISGGALDSPWGLAIAPAGFGTFGGDLLVGNFGDGRIDAYNPNSGKFMGALDGTDGKPLVIDGLWGLTFGNGSLRGGGLDTLYFTAGPNGESNGLFGSLTAVPEPSTWAMLFIGFGGLGFAAMRRRSPRFTET